MQPIFALLLAVGGALCACVSPPRASVASGHGTVRAPTEREAKQIATLLDDLHPRVRALLPGTRNPEVEVWLQDELQIFWLVEPSSEVVAMNFSLWDRIHLKRASDSLSEDLAHELVHLLLDQSWQALPPVLEEGLADHVGITLQPEIAAEFRAGRLLSVLADLGGYTGRVRFAEPTPSGAESLVFRLLDSGHTSVDPLAALQPSVSEIAPHSRSSAKSTLYGLGFLVVSRIYDRVGYSGLHQEAMAARAQGLNAIAPERLLELAELGPELALWVAATLDALGADELKALARQHAAILAPMLGDACAPLFPALDGELFLRRLQPRFSLRRAGPEILLADVPGFVELFCKAWPRSYAQELFEHPAQTAH